MIHDLKPYPAYKDSGVPWLGQVPEHWEVKRNKLFMKEINDRSEDGLEELLTVSQYTGVTRRREKLSEEGELLTNAASLVGYKHVMPNDLVMNIMLAWNGSLGVSPIEGIVSPAYCVYRSDSSIEPRYLHYLFRTPLYTGVFKTESTGVVDSRLRLYPEVFFRLQSLIPPLSEQSAIVRYLDYMDRRIRRYIHAKQKLIKLLEEQKQAIIHRAVTRGLDPNVKLKPSGVEWLGDVPEGWEVKPAKRYYREIDERSLSGSEELLSVSHITGVTPRSEKNITMFMAESYIGYKLCRENDLVINTMWAWAGALGVSKQTGIVSSSYAVYRPIQENIFINQFIDLLLRTKPYVDEYIRCSTGIRSSRLRLYPEMFLRIPIICPPINEQQIILENVFNSTSNFEHAIQSALREISLLREYRTRLIADVVTGKIDVREAAASLPDEVEEPEVLEDETLEDGDNVENELEDVSGEEDT